MSERLSNAPVYYAIAQAQFNPVARMSMYVEEIQDRLRREGYPLFTPQRVTQLVLSAPGQLPQGEPQVTFADFWHLTRRDGSSGFILTPSAINYHTTHYDTHNEFIQELLHGLAVVHGVTSLDHISRLGLRYLDAVRPRDGETVEQYLVGGLRGIEFDPPPRHRLTESVFETNTGPLVPTGTLVARVYRMTGPLVFPPDLRSSGLKIHPKFEPNEPRDHAVVDTDHFAEGRMPVDMDKLGEQLLSLHATVQSVFRATTTDHARRVWA